MAINRKFIAERTAGKICRDNPDTPFLSAKVDGYDRVEALTPNGCAYDEGDDPGEYMFQQGARAGGPYARQVFPDKKYGGNRTGE